MRDAFPNAGVLELNVRDLNHLKDLGILDEEELLFLINPMVVPIINLARIGLVRPDVLISSLLLSFFESGDLFINLVDNIMAFIFAFLMNDLHVNLTRLSALLISERDIHHGDKSTAVTTADRCPCHATRHHFTEFLGLDNLSPSQILVVLFESTFVDH